MLGFLGTGPGCDSGGSFEYYFKDHDRHSINADYAVLDDLKIDYQASTGTFSLFVQDVWEVLPADPPSSFADGWDFEEPLPSRASTRITYTHDASVRPTHVLTQSLNNSYSPVGL